MSHLENIEKKGQATFDDGLIAAFLLLGKPIPHNFDTRLKFMKDNKWLPGSIHQNQVAPLNKGVISQLLANALELKGSILFSIFGTQRYAVRLMVYHNLMPPLSSEWEHLSGDELLEIIRLASDFQENRKGRK